MPSGRPDWFGTIVAAGKYGTTYIPIALDVDGFITATMKGAYDTLLKTIAVDSSGVMKANLSAQDLNFLTVRPAYGEAARESGFDLNVAQDEESALVTVTGRGVALGGIITWSMSNGDATALYVRIYTEEVMVCNMSLSNLYAYNIKEGNKLPLFLGRYDPTNRKYAIGISPGTSFETKIEVKAYNAGTETLTVIAELFYALVPS